MWLVYKQSGAWRIEGVGGMWGQQAMYVQPAVAYLKMSSTCCRSQQRWQPDNDDGGYH